ncbi:2-dehydro-3-deoxygluconokinase [Haloactinospora alba]|uniref:2-dehydro-3-deoxygluconokinase n=1 Tax=Haloactinospora alba TaxID=405555 RepID=A0A543NNN6_9ACTN|nr:sugar kinase [Haloactinospora alba]TQN33435.1 2-dehydro-3-deoxygluconokinase [Haloactinospora alba]
MRTQHGQAVDAVCVGETMALLVPDPPEPPDTAATFRRDIGGAESNVAVHLARAGNRVAWHSALGDDAFGRHIRARLTAEGVEVTGRTDAERPTGLYLKELDPGGTRVRYYRQGSAASALDRPDADRVWQQRPRLVHTTGITTVLSDSSRRLVEELLPARPDRGEPGGVPGADAPLRSFDVNYRPALHGPAEAELLRELAQRADVVFCGLDEAQMLWDARTVTEVRDTLPDTELLVVKRGSDGATAHRAGQWWHRDAPDVTVVEPTGAGDAFAAGVLHRLLAGDEVGACLAEGNRLAGTVLELRGDVPPPAGEDASRSRRQRECGSVNARQHPRDQ